MATGSAQRRELILQTLQNSRAPLSAAALAGKFSVSRQIVVGDIALLRAAGETISATPRGYVYQKPQGGGAKTKIIACCHGQEKMLMELYTVVDYGCALLDVTVNHAVYGQISGQLQIFSRFDADQFAQKLQTCADKPLSTLTGDIHLHTVQYESEEKLEKMLEALAREGILFAENRPKDGSTMEE